MGIDLNYRGNPKRKVDINAVVRERGAHVDNGWPHLSRHSKLCMCVDSCCQGANGCKCKMCLCQRLPEWHTERSPYPLPSADIISSMEMDGITNGLPKRRANGGKNSNGYGTADTRKMALYRINSTIRKRHDMRRNSNRNRTR